MPTNTWPEDREALVALIELYDDSFRPQTARDVAIKLGIDTETALRRMIHLSHAGEPYAVFKDESTLDGKDVYFIEPTERGYREVGQWPSVDSVREAFVAQLAEKIKTEPDVKRKSGLERLLDATQSVGIGAMNSVLAAAIGKQFGL